VLFEQRSSDFAIVERSPVREQHRDWVVFQSVSGPGKFAEVVILAGDRGERS